jgi:4-hydroxy-4-methyl-2-oxoglutarate aldolase
MGDDTTLFATIRERLFTAVIGDVMDVEGLTRQFLPPEVRALRPDMIVVGRAMPVLEADCAGDAVGHSGRTEPFGLMLRALDDLKRDEVYICTGASRRYALWGEMMSTRAKALGAAGAVLGGFHRDTNGILALGFPVFSEGAYAQDQRLRGRVVDFRCAIEFENGVMVRPGDVVVGDIDGVLVIPSAHVTDIVHAALKKVEGEEAVRELIEKGMTTQAIWEKTGIM